MRIITYNVNGIRAAIKRGFIDWLKTDPADIVCIQEVKAHETDIERLQLNQQVIAPIFFLHKKKDIVVLVF